MRNVLNMSTSKASPSPSQEKHPFSYRKGKCGSIYLPTKLCSPSHPWWRTEGKIRVLLGSRIQTRCEDSWHSATEDQRMGPIKELDFIVCTVIPYCVQPQHDPLLIKVQRGVCKKEVDWNMKCINILKKIFFAHWKVLRPSRNIKMKILYCSTKIGWKIFAGQTPPSTNPSDDVCPTAPYSSLQAAKNLA